MRFDLNASRQGQASRARQWCPQDLAFGLDLHQFRQAEGVLGLSSDGLPEVLAAALGLEGSFELCSLLGRQISAADAGLAECAVIAGGQVGGAGMSHSVYFLLC